MGSVNSGRQSGWLGSGSRRNDPLTAANVNAIKDALRRGRLTVAAPLELIDTPDGSLLRWAGASPLGRIGKTGAGGVPALAGSTPGTISTVTLYDFDGSTLTANETGVTVFNISSTAVGANKWIMVKVIFGGYYFVDVESC